MFPEVARKLIKVVGQQEWLLSIRTIPISRSNETSVKTKDEQSVHWVQSTLFLLITYHKKCTLHPVVTLEATSRLKSPDQVDLIELPHLQLHSRVVSQPPVTWLSLEAVFRGVLLRSLGELGAHLVQEEGLMNWSLEVSIQLSAEEGDQVFNNLMPGRSESPVWESGEIENEPYY